MFVEIVEVTKGFLTVRASVVLDVVVNGSCMLLQVLVGDEPKSAKAASVSRRTAQILITSALWDKTRSF